MNINFRLKSLHDSEFTKYFEMSNAELEKIGALKMTVDQFPGFPCRVSLEDAKPGEEVILLPYLHHDVNSPYRASGPIFVRKIAKTAYLAVNEIPKMFHHRLLSIRGYNQTGMMQDAAVVEGAALKEQLIRFFENQEISYIHIHNAKPGCYGCLVERA